VERISQGFKDVSLSFQVNPLTYDIIVNKNETAIARSVRNLILTNRGERFFNPYIGSKVNALLFENMDASTASIIKSEIETTINNYEPRVDLIDVIVNPNYDDNEFNVNVRYYIVGIDSPAQQLSFVLQPTR
jgi:phage baseplate assembly protein W